MRATERVLYRVTRKGGDLATGALPDEATRLANVNEIGTEEWAALLEHARSCDARAYQDLYARLSRFRQCFSARVFPDPEGAYRQFVRDLVELLRCGFLPDPESLLAQARRSALRRASERIRSLTMAARVLSTLPKRHREVLIRAQLALYSSAALTQGAQAMPMRRAALSDERVFGGRRNPTAASNPIVGGVSPANGKLPAAVA